MSQSRRRRASDECRNLIGPNALASLANDRPRSPESEETARRSSVPSQAPGASSSSYECPRQAPGPGVSDCAHRDHRLRHQVPVERGQAVRRALSSHNRPTARSASARVGAYSATTAASDLGLVDASMRHSVGGPVSGICVAVTLIVRAPALLRRSYTMAWPERNCCVIRTAPASRSSVKVGSPPGTTSDRRPAASGAPAPWPRFAGCARASRRTARPPARANAPRHHPARSASG